MPFVWSRRYPTAHPFARIHLTDNLVQFRTRRYAQNPLIVQGPGAGPEVTAGGIFADLLRLAFYLAAALGRGSRRGAENAGNFFSSVALCVVRRHIDVWECRRGGGVSSRRFARNRRSRQAS